MHQEIRNVFFPSAFGEHSEKSRFTLLVFSFGLNAGAVFPKALAKNGKCKID